MNTTPLQILVGATRLVAICFGLKALEQLAGAAAYYSTVKSMNSSIAESMPGAWGLYVPGLIVSLILAVGTWFAAPFICRLALSSEEPPPEEPVADVSANELMIFLAGVFFVGWGLARLSDSLVPILRLKVQGASHELAMVEQIGFYTTAIIMGAGGIMIFRFASIYHWLQRRKVLLNGTAAGK
jgi:hypothetical protein